MEREPSAVRRNAVGSALALAVLLAAVPAGAGAQDPTPKPSVLFWTDSVRQPGVETYANLVKDTVDVKIETVSTSDIPGKIQLFNQAGSGWPDAFFGEPSHVSLMTDPSYDFALELTPDLVGQDFLDAFGNGNNWCKIDGKTWCLKNDLAQTVLWYDKTIFDQLGLTVPTTMTEWAATAMTLKAAGYISGAIGDQNFYASYLWPSGCPMAGEVSHTEVRINSQDPMCTRVANLVQPLVDAGALDIRSSFDASFLSEVAQQGKVAMTFGPSWFGDFVIKPAASWAVPAGRITAAPMPIWEGDSVAHSGEWGGGIYVVSKHAQNPQAAVDAIKWMVSDPTYVKSGPTFPAYGPANKIWTARVATDPYYAADPAAAMTVQADLINPSVTPVRINIDEQIGSTLVLPITNGSSIQDAINSFDDSLTNLAQQAGYTVSQ